MLHTRLACVLKAPVTGAENQLRALREHGAKEFREGQVPTDGQSDLAKTCLTYHRLPARVEIIAFREPEVRFAITAQNCAGTVDIVGGIVESCLVALDNRAGHNIEGVFYG